MSPAQASAQLFKGDAAHLVDELIRCSQLKPAALPHLEGRELVPWTDDSVVPGAGFLPLENRRPQSASKFPARHARSPTAAAAAAQERGASKRSKVASPTQIPRAASNGGRRLSADYTPAGFACPAVAASPKPENVPMPTGLMSRAVRSRSPSPPKDSFFAVSVLAHVHAVAA
jgi:hypothetical protein